MRVSVGGLPACHSSMELKVESRAKFLDEHAMRKVNDKVRFRHE
jgi:hypothetical protein